MTKLYHCTSIYKAINIFEDTIFFTKNGQDNCINMHLDNEGERTTFQADETGCFILLEWLDKSNVDTGSIRIGAENSKLNELYIEWWAEDNSGGIWRSRVRAPYNGQCLVMKEIVFTIQNARDAVNIELYKTTFLQRLKEYLSPQQKQIRKEKEENDLINRLDEINRSLKVKPLKLKIQQR